MQRTGCGNKMAAIGYSEDVSIERYMLLAKTEALNMPYGMSATFVYLRT